MSIPSSWQHGQNLFLKCARPPGKSGMHKRPPSPRILAPQHGCSSNSCSSMLLACRKNFKATTGVGEASVSDTRLHLDCYEAPTGVSKPSRRVAPGVPWVVEALGAIRGYKKR